jgi:hypothetical protein
MTVHGGTTQLLLMLMLVGHMIALLFYNKRPVALLLRGLHLTCFQRTMHAARDFANPGAQQHTGLHDYHC